MGDGKVRVGRNMVSHGPCMGGRQDPWLSGLQSMVSKRMHSCVKAMLAVISAGGTRHSLMLEGIAGIRHSITGKARILEAHRSVSACLWHWHLHACESRILRCTDAAAHSVMIATCAQMQWSKGPKLKCLAVMHGSFHA